PVQGEPRTVGRRGLDPHRDHLRPGGEDRRPRRRRSAAGRRSRNRAGGPARPARGSDHGLRLRNARQRRRRLRRSAGDRQRRQIPAAGPQRRRHGSRDDHLRTVPGADRRAPLHQGPARPRPHHPLLRRAAAVGVPDVAERLFRVLLLRSLLAGFPPHGLPPRRPRLRAATAPVRQIASLLPAPGAFLTAAAGTEPGAEPWSVARSWSTPSRDRGMSEPDRGGTHATEVLMAENVHTYVLDTSVLLSDPGALLRFAEHHVVIPLIVVSE